MRSIDLRVQHPRDGVRVAYRRGHSKCRSKAERRSQETMRPHSSANPFASAQANTDSLKRIGSSCTDEKRRRCRRYLASHLNYVIRLWTVANLGKLALEL